MYTGHWAQVKPETPAIVMAASGETLSYGELVITARGVGVRTERPVDQKTEA